MLLTENQEQASEPKQEPPRSSESMGQPASEPEARSVQTAPITDSESLLFEPDSTLIPASLNEFLSTEELAREIGERIAALLLLIILSPLLFVIATLIAFENLGPVFFHQRRVGKNEKIFSIHKFRTMYTDAEKDGPFICDSYQDSRITPLGKILRKSRFDELPQLWNIMMGEMSFVGPRPEQPVFHEEFKAITDWEKRVSVKPGVTGPAVLSQSISHNPREKIIADLEYIKNRSLSYDIKLIGKTIVKLASVFRGVLP